MLAYSLAYACLLSHLLLQVRRLSAACITCCRLLAKLQKEDRIHCRCPSVSRSSVRALVATACLMMSTLYCPVLPASCCTHCVVLCYLPHVVHTVHCPAANAALCIAAPVILTPCVCHLIPAQAALCLLRVTLF